MSLGLYREISAPLSNSCVPLDKSLIHSSSEPQCPHLWSGEKHNTTHNKSWKEEYLQKGVTRGNAFLHVINLNFLTPIGSVSHLLTATVSGYNVFGNYIHSALSSINSRHVVPHFLLSENSSFTLHLLNGEKYESKLLIFLKKLSSLMFS